MCVCVCVCVCVSLLSVQILEELITRSAIFFFFHAQFHYNNVSLRLKGIKHTNLLTDQAFITPHGSIDNSSVNKPLKVMPISSFLTLRMEANLVLASLALDNQY